MTKQELIDKIVEAKGKYEGVFDLKYDEGTEPTNIQKVYSVLNSFQKYLEDPKNKSSEKQYDFYSEVLDKLDKFADDVIQDKAQNDKFSFSNYKYINVISKISDDIGYELPKEFSKIKYTPEVEVEKLTGEYSIRNVIDNQAIATKKVQFSVGNPLLEKVYTPKQIKEMGEVFSQNLAKEAHSYREGAFPLLYACLMAKNYSPEKIFNGEVQESDYREFYERAMDIKNPEKKEETLNRFTEDYVRGMRFMASEVERRFEYSKRNENSTLFDPVNLVLGNMFFIAGTNYLQDKEKFVPRVNEACKNLNLDYHNGKFHPGQAYSFLFTVNASRGNKNAVDILSAIDYAPNVDIDYEKLIAGQLELNIARKSEFSTAMSYTLSSNMLLKDFEGVEELKGWLKENRKDPGVKAFLAHNFETGKFFSDISRNSETGKFRVSVDISELKKDYNTFKKEHKDEILTAEVLGAIRGDYKENSLSSGDIKYVADEHKEAEEITENLDRIVQDRFERINETVENLSRDIDSGAVKRNEDTLKWLNKVGKALADYERNPGVAGKYKIVTAFTNEELVPPIGEKPCKDEREFDSAVYSVKDLSGERYSPFVKGEGKLLSKEEAEKQCKRLSVIKEDVVYKRATEFPHTKFSTKVISQVFKRTLDRLKETSELDEEGKLTGNSELFNEMYKSIEDVVNYKETKASKLGEGLNDLLGKAQEKIDAYIKKRDKFIVWTSKGRERLELAKDISLITKTAKSEYAALSDSVIKQHYKIENQLNREPDFVSSELKGKDVGKSETSKELEKTVKVLGKI